MSKALISLYILLMALGVNADEPKSIILSVDNYPPYIDGRRYDKGSLGEIVQTVFSHHHREVKFEFMSWPETQLKIAQGQGFTFMWYKSEDSELDWIYSQPIDYLVTDLVFKQDKNIQFKRLDQLRKYKIGLTHGYSYGKQFDSYKQYLSIVESQSDYEGLKRFLAGETDILLVEPLVAKSLLNDWFSGEIEKLQFQHVDYLSRQPIYLVCSQKYAGCAHGISLFNQSLRQLKADNKL